MYAEVVIKATIRPLTVHYKETVSIQMLVALSSLSTKGFLFFTGIYFRGGQETLTVNYLSPKQSAYAGMRNTKSSASSTRSKHSWTAIPHRSQNSKSLQCTKQVETF